jgi:ribosomal protein S18 acetylase RimI-like enzyme
MYDRLSSLVQIYPYDLVQEGLFDDGPLDFRAPLDNCATAFLEPSDMKTISAIPEVSHSEDKLLDRVATGCLCLGIKHNGEIVAYSWCNLRRLGYNMLNFPLKENEAYLFDARTLKAYRGKSLAPYLRYELYKHLAELGRTRLFSCTSLLNTSAVKFKKRLRAKRIRVYLYFNFFGRYSFHIPLKNYKN